MRMVQQPLFQQERNRSGSRIMLVQGGRSPGEPREGLGVETLAVECQHFVALLTSSAPGEHQDVMTLNSLHRLEDEALLSVAGQPPTQIVSGAQRLSLAGESNLRIPGCRVRARYALPEPHPQVSRTQRSRRTHRSIRAGLRRGRTQLIGARLLRLPSQFQRAP